MPLNQAIENTGETPGTGPAGGFGRASFAAGKEMTANDDFFGQYSGRNQMKSTG